MTGRHEAVEWARLGGEGAVVATGTRRWVISTGAHDQGEAFVTPMRGPGSAASTRNLLDGAVVVGARSSPPGEPSPPLTPLRWAWRLIGLYDTTSATPDMTNEAARRLAGCGHDAVAAHCRRVSREERGHDRLALLDLRALGYDAEALVANVVHPTAQALVEHFRAIVTGAAPIGCLGYAYALERLASRVPARYVEAVEAMLPAGVRATRCLRVHSGLGSDVGHVTEAVDVIARLPAGDRTTVAQACYETARLAFTAVPGGPLSEVDLWSLLSPYATKGAVPCPR